MSASKKPVVNGDDDDWDSPCLNCGRHGTIPGQLITDYNNNTFCSPDCGWSHLLRPLEQHRMAKAAALQAHAAPRQHRRTHSRRSSRSSRSSHSSQQSQQQDRQRPRPTLQINSDKDLIPTKEASSPRTPTSARKPPRLPSKSSSKRVEADRTPSLRYSSNAMFEYTSMMCGGMDP